jgi:CBS domain-containing protein
MNASQVMTTPVQCCCARDSLARAAQIMWDTDCGCVPVIDDRNRVVAILTDRDICMAALMRGKALADIPIVSAATRFVCCALEDDPIEIIESLMRDAQIHRLPVTTPDGVLRGIVSMSDLVRESERARGREQALSNDAIAETLVAISSPRMR